MDVYNNVNDNLDSNIQDKNRRSWAVKSAGNGWNDERGGFDR